MAFGLGENMKEKIRCPQCGFTLIFANKIDAEIKCTRCKQIILIQKEKSEEHAQTKVVK
jgi:phage FluMu protein Com